MDGTFQSLLSQVGSKRCIPGEGRRQVPPHIWPEERGRGTSSLLPEAQCPSSFEENVPRHGNLRYCSFQDSMEATLSCSGHHQTFAPQFSRRLSHEGKCSPSQTEGRPLVGIRPDQASPHEVPLNHLRWVIVPCYAYIKISYEYTVAYSVTMNTLASNAEYFHSSRVRT